MSKLSALKNRLRARTALFLASLFIILSGCAGLGGSTVQESFYPEYYAAKHLDNADVVKLRGFMASADGRVSAPATLLLGVNYLRYGDKNFGRLLIEKSYASPDLDPQMRIFGKLWKMESLLSEKNTEAAERIKNDILALKRDDTYIRTLKIYCLNESRPLKAGEDPSVCVEEKFKAPAGLTEIAPETGEVPQTAPDNAAGNITETGTDNMTYEEYLEAMGIGGTGPEPEKSLDENAEINVIGGDVMSEMVQGMIFAISDLKTGFKVNSVSEDAASSGMDGDSAVVRLNSTEITAGGRTVSFGVDWDELIRTAATLKRNGNIPNVVISAPNGKIRYARDMAGYYDGTKVNVKVLNYDNPAFQAQLRSYLDGVKDAPVLMIGVGTEGEIINFVPVAKFLQGNKNQRIMLVTSSLSDTNLKNDYKTYFRDVYVLTPVQLVNNKKFNDINLGYEAFFGSPMNLRNILGYDAVVYLSSLIEPAEGDKFLSNINGFVDGAAYRSIGLYKIGKKLDITEIQYEVLKPEPGEKYSSGNGEQGM